MIPNDVTHTDGTRFDSLKMNSDVIGFYAS